MTGTEDASLRSNRFLRFLVAGCLNTLFGFAVYSAAIVAGAPVWVALMVSLVAGIFFNFFSTGRYVFRDLALSRLPRFVLCYLAAYGVNLQLIGWVLKWIDGQILAQAVLAFPMAIFTYLLMVRIAFVSRPRKNEQSDE